MAAPRCWDEPSKPQLCVSSWAIPKGKNGECCVSRAANSINPPVLQRSASGCAWLARFASAVVSSLWAQKQGDATIPPVVICFPDSRRFSSCLSCVGEREKNRLTVSESGWLCHNTSVGDVTCRPPPRSSVGATAGSPSACDGLTPFAYSSLAVAGGTTKTLPATS